MHVGLNLLHLVPGETGGAELYARRLIPALLDANAGVRLTAFCAREAVSALRAEPWGSKTRIVEVPVQARSRLRRALAEQTLLARAVRRSDVQLLHNVFTTAPAAPGVPQVTTIHDLIYKRFPETHGGLFARGLAMLVPLAARRSARIIVPSRATKDDVVRFLGVDAGRVDVTYEGPGLPEPSEPLRDVRALLGLDSSPIVLTASAKRPHKNLGRLF